MAANKRTEPEAASNASSTLRNQETGKNSKSAAGSALSQAHGSGKETSAKSAASASETLRDGRTSKTSKSAAGSALSQKSSKK